MCTAGVAQPTARALAQDSIPWPRADRLSVTVSVPTVQIRGDTLRVRYRLASGAGSEQAGIFFAVRCPGTVVRARGPLGWYASFGLIGDSAAVDWSSLAKQTDLAIGSALAGFEFEAIGALDIVGFLVQGDHPLPVATDSTERLVMAPPSVWADAARGQTIGVVAPPADSSPSGLTARLAALQNRVCDALGWISNRGVCQSLRAKLDDAAAAIGRGGAQAAAGQLGAYVQELDAQHGPEPGKHVNDSAYWLLRVNAEYVLARL
jgi:hypothetical protein